MRTEDVRIRQELVESDELGGSYVPRMEAVHVRNAERLKEIINECGWPDEQTVGEDGAKAAWFIVQHAIGFPDLQREFLTLPQHSAAEGPSSMARGLSGRPNSNTGGPASALPKLNGLMIRSMGEFGPGNWRNLSE